LDERYRDIYASIYVERTAASAVFSVSTRVSTPDDQLWASLVRDVIEEAQEATDRQLREDAKALLAINFLDLVVHPLRLGGRTSAETLASALSADIRMLIVEARPRESESSSAAQLSSHEIIDSLSKNWDRLRIVRLDLWGQ
jgi:hypothetical protein